MKAKSRMKLLNGTEQMMQQRAEALAEAVSIKTVVARKGPRPSKGSKGPRVPREIKHGLEQHRREVGHRLLIAQESTGLSPTEFARRIGITPQQLWNYTEGKNYPERLALVRACDAFGFSIDWFYRGVMAKLDPSLAQLLFRLESERSGSKK